MFRRSNFRNLFLVGGALLLGLTMASALAAAQTTPGPALPPLSQPVLQRLLNDPEAMAQFRAAHPPIPLSATRPAAETPKGKATDSGTWYPLTNLLPGSNPASNPILLTDGTVMVHVSCTADWYRLTPDNTGSYINGTWTQTASMPGGYAPRFFASGVLPDGRLIVEGGEYNDTNCDTAWTTAGAIYDPVANSWQSVSPPSGWTHIGDAESTVLANGTFLLSNCCSTQTALLNATTLLWTSTGTGKFDYNDEENWTLLPNGDVLTVDAYTGGTSAKCGTHTEEYVPGSGTWIAAGNTTAQLADCSGAIKSYEAPTQILRPNGTVVAFGATTTKSPKTSPVHTGIFTTSASKGKGKWSGGIAMPKIGKVNYTMADAPAAILPDGNVLIAASPGEWVDDSNNAFPAPTHFFIFTGTSFSQVGDVADSSSLSSYEMNFLVLPTGEILGVETDYSNMEVFRGIGTYLAAWQPTISSMSSTTLGRGGTYTITGTQLAGLTQGAAYGDDGQASTNFPLVRITMTGDSHVFYARTHDFTSLSVAAGAVSTVSFDVPHNIELGGATLVVVANGIPSAPQSVTTSCSPHTPSVNPPC